MSVTEAAFLVLLAIVFWCWLYLWIRALRLQRRIERQAEAFLDGVFSSKTRTSIHHR